MEWSGHENWVHESGKMSLIDISTNYSHYFYWKSIGTVKRILILILGFKGLSNDEDEGREHIAKKWIYILSNFVAAINSDPLSWSNVGDVSWISILKDRSQVQKQNENSSKLFTSSIKRRTRRFQVVVVQ